MKNIIILYLLLFFMLFISCTGEKQPIQLEFKIQDIVVDIQVKRGTRLSKETIPYLKNLKTKELFMDENKLIKYNGERINSDLTIFVELEIEENRYNNLTDNQTFDLIKDDYLNQFSRAYNQNYTIDDITIYAYYGNYNGAYVVWIIENGEGIGWFTMTEYNIGGVELVFPTTSQPYVWYKGYFYHLETAYSKGLLTQENIKSISSILQGNKEE